MCLGSLPRREEDEADFSLAGEARVLHVHEARHSRAGRQTRAVPVGARLCWLYRPVHRTIKSTGMARMIARPGGCEGVSSGTARSSGLCVSCERWLTQVRQTSIQPPASTGEPTSGSADAPTGGFVMHSGTNCPLPSPRRRGRSGQRCPAHCAGRATSSSRATPTLSSTSPRRGVSCGFVVRASITGARKRAFFQAEGTVTRSAVRANPLE
jgi:hypothetical protein